MLVCLGTKSGNIKESLSKVLCCLKKSRPKQKQKLNTFVQSQNVSQKIIGIEEEMLVANNLQHSKNPNRIELSAQTDINSEIMKISLKKTEEIPNHDVENKCKKVLNL